MSRETIKEMVIGLASDMEYVHLKDAVEVFEEEMAMRLHESFEDYIKECELRGEREYVTCTQCPVHDECTEIHNIEDETGLWFEEMIDEECECIGEECACEECCGEELSDEEICSLLANIYGFQDEEDDEYKYKPSMVNKPTPKEEDKKKEMTRELVVEAISSFLDLLVLLS